MGTRAAAPEALWAAWDECTCAARALLATFISALISMLLASILSPPHAAQLGAGALYVVGATSQERGPEARRDGEQLTSIPPLGDSQT